MWTYRNRMRAFGLSKWLLAFALVASVGYIAGVYITYADLVTPNYWGTAMFYAFCGVLIRKLIK